MQTNRIGYLALAVLLVILLFVRLELASSVGPLSYSSYARVRSVEHILSTGFPLASDELSVTGNVRIGSPVFDYLLASVVMLSPAFYKIVPNLLVVLLLVPIFFLAKRISRSTVAGLLAVVIAASGPIVFARYLNTPSPVPLAAGILIVTLAMLNDPQKYLYWIIGLTLALTFIHPMIFVLVFSLIGVYVLLRLEGYGADTRIAELFFFTLMLAVWYNVLVYKNALFMDGLRVVWQNLPIQYAQVAFGDFTFLTLLYGLGVITFLFGALGTYHALFESRVKQSIPVIAGSIVVVLFMLLRVLEVEVGIFLLSLLLSIMAAHGILISVKYLRRTKAPWVVYPLGMFLLLLFIFTAILPALSNASYLEQNAPSKDDIEAFEYIRQMTPTDAVILTTVREGAAVQHFTKRATLTDSDFLLIQNPEEMVGDIDSVYTARFVAPVVNMADKWGFDYVLFSNDARRQYDRERVQVDSLCLPRYEASRDVSLYAVECEGSR